MPVSNSRSDVLATARAILAEHSLADLTMRRLATELGVNPNALYWHFPNKQTMLAALADDILERVSTPDDGGPAGTAAAAARWDDELRALARATRAALLAVPDSAEVVSSSWASGLSQNVIATRFAEIALTGGLPERAARGTATALCQLIIGLTIEEQTRAQMERLGVIGPVGRDFAGEFADALDILVDGARASADRSSALAAPG